MIRTGKISVNVEPLVRRNAEAMGRTVFDELQATARLIAVSLAHSTQPYGKDQGTKATAERRVAADIRKVFATPSGVFALLEKKEGEAAANQFWSAYKSRDLGRMSGIMAAESLGLAILSKPEKSIHQARRKNNGRTGGRPSHLVTDPAALARYIASRQRKVGFAKSGWANAARDCGGTRGIPQWAAGRHKGAAPGGATINRDPLHPSITIRNEVSYIRQALPKAQQDAAVAIAYEKIMKSLQAKLRRRPRAA